MSIYQKHRPTELKDIVGNTATINALESILVAVERPHTLLLTGQSGCGKTTIARIMARRFGCHPKDIIELNAANFRGIDTAREIIQQAKLKPMYGEVKAWILEEVHRSTLDFQSALLRILEDTPKHVYFLLPTTDPQKLLKTIINRCTQFTVQVLPENRIVYLINRVCDKEGKTIPKDICNAIAKDCQGSPRLALNMLETVIDLDEDQQLRTIQQATEEESEVIELCRALVNKKKWNEINKILRGLQGTDTEKIRLAVLGYCSKILLSKEDLNAFLIMDSFKDPFFNSGFAGLTRACFEAVFK